jgi:hypothetical protein
MDYFIMKNFIKVKVIGGIGNQLFIFIFGLAISEQLKTKLVVEDSLLYFGSNKSRRMEITNLIFDGFKIEFKRSRLSKLLIQKSNSFLSKIAWKFFQLNKKTINENTQSKPQFRFAEGQTFSGYFQDWFYADFINEHNSNFNFKLKNPSSIFNDLVKASDQSNLIFVHVRVGDYLNFPNIYSILPEHYFLDSLKHLGLTDNDEIWLFTEDFMQAKNYYPELFNRADNVIDNKSGLSDLESFSLLCKGTKLIASNSTFSMWAAWFVNKNGFSAVVPMQLGIKGGSRALIDERWDRYDLEKRTIFPGSKSNLRYLERKKEFLSKFE